MFISEAPLGDYLYGMRSIPEFAPGGTLRVRHEPIAEHRDGEKVIPSGFFGQKDAQKISAILFSNSGTAAKFSRMGYQQGIATERLWMGRYGLRADNDPDAAEPNFFAEEVGSRHERWSDDLVVFHNPNAEIPLPDEALGNVAVQYALIDGQIRHTLKPFHVFSSQTITLIPPPGRDVEFARRRGVRELAKVASALAAKDEMGP